MRIEWGWFLTVTVLSVVGLTANARGQATASIGAGPAYEAESQVPLAASGSPGWPGQPATAATDQGAAAYVAGGPQMQGTQPPAAAMGYPSAGPGFGVAPGVAPAYGGMPAYGPPPGMGAYAPASYYEGGPEMPPQPFPGPVSMEQQYQAALGGGHPHGGFGCKSCGGSGCNSCGGMGCNSCGGMGCTACTRMAAGAAAAEWSPAGSTPCSYGEGGRCAPRWYDVQLDGMYLKRDNAGRTVNFASDGIGGNIALSTDDLSFDEELGLSFTGAIQLFAGTNLEFTYFGLLDFSSGAAATRNDFGGFFSIYSDFGQTPFNGFDETDRSAFQRIIYSSTLDNFELNFRRRWTGANCRVQGSTLVGVRYLYLAEEFLYETTGGDDFLTAPIEVNGRSATTVNTRNSLTGLQFGGDLWTCLIPGVSIGGAMKGGVYGNYGNQQTFVFASTTAPAQSSTIMEETGINDLSFVGEGRFEMIYKMNPNWTARMGYSFLFIDGVALASENFHPGTPPNVQGAAARSAFSNDNGNIFYHGFFSGFEWTW